MDVAVVIPVFNQAHYTRNCLDTLREAGVAENSVLVVDNGSTDDTAACLAARPLVRVIRNDTNRGCGGAWNQGTQAGSATWTVLLNNDVLIPHGWLEGLRAFAEDEGFDVASPAICNGVKVDYDFPAYARQFMSRMQRVKRVGTASGVCFMVHERVFKAVGFFDEDRRLGGYEDDEFFRRCRQAGFRLGRTGRSFLHHFGSVTQKAMKADMRQPNASLGDREYYRQKYGLTWLKRRRARMMWGLQCARWRLSERWRYGCTLVSHREGGKFIWE